MRILLIHPFDAYSGAQRVAATLADVFNDLGHDLTISLGFGDRGFVSDCIDVKRFFSINIIWVRKILYPIWILWMWPRIFYAALKNNVIWANAVYAIPVVLPALWLKPKCVVIHIHEIEFPRVFHRLAAWGIRRGARVVCVSETHKQILSLSADVLHNCVGFFSEQEKHNPSVLLFVGAVSELKGFNLFVDVVRELRSKNIRALAFVPSIPPKASALLTAAQMAGIEVVVGVSDPKFIYPGATLLLQCTDPELWTETFSLVMAEALASGVPVATTGMKVAPEILSDAWAFDVPGRNPKEIAAKIDDLFNSSEKIDLLCLAALRRRNHFTYDRFKTNVSTILNNMESV